MVTMKFSYGILISPLAAAVLFHHRTDLLRIEHDEVVGLQAPLPVEADRARRIHAGAAVEAEEVLHWHDGEAGARGVGKADELRGYVLRVLAVGADELRDTGARGIVDVARVPADRRVVVMRARVDDAVLRRDEADAAAVIEVEREMQDFHAWEVAVVAELLDLVRDDAEVFRHDGQVADCRLDGVEERLARARHPAAVDGRLRLAVDFPVRLEAAEMVDAHDIDELVELAEARNPPGVVLFLHGLPVILRVAPELARRAEVIGRNPRDGLGRAVGVQVKELLMAPDVGAVARDENRHVAEDADALLLRVVMEPRPLRIKQELQEFLEADMLFETVRKLRERLFLAALDGVRPFRPFLMFEVILRSHEEQRHYRCCLIILSSLHL